MSEIIKSWGDHGFVNNKHQDESVPNFSLVGLSESQVLAAQQENLARDEALILIDNLLCENGNVSLSPKHPFRNVVLSLRPDSPFTPSANGNSWITIEKHDTGRITAIINDVRNTVSLSAHQGKIHRNVQTKATCLGSFAIRTEQEQIA